MENPIVRRLRAGAPLSPSDEAALLSALEATSTVNERRSDLIREGEAPEGLLMVLEGFACRYKTLRNGSRQILALLLPGDFCDVHAALFREMDHSIATLSRCTIATVPRSTMDGLMAERPNIRRAIEWATLVEESILREWLVNVGARRAAERMAHLFCEVQARLAAVGIGSEDHFPFPLIQEQLCQTLGLSVVHVNRTLIRLRDEGLAIHKSGAVQVLNGPGLARLADFRSNYLHLAPMFA